jgi:hypothetical protein
VAVEELPFFLRDPVEPEERTLAERGGFRSASELDPPCDVLDEGRNGLVDHLACGLDGFHVQAVGLRARALPDVLDVEQPELERDVVGYVLRCQRAELCVGELGGLRDELGVGVEERRQQELRLCGIEGVQQCAPLARGLGAPG